MNALRTVLFAIVTGFAPIAIAGRIEISQAAQPQLAVNAGGTVWLAYGQSSVAPATKPGEREQKHAGHAPAAGRIGEVFVARSDDGGATFGPPVRIARVSQLMLGNRRGPRIAVQGDRLTVTAMGEELLAFSSSDGGRTWTPPVTVNDVPTSAREGLHDLAGAPDGEVIVVWLDLRNGPTELWSASSADGGRTWGKNQRIYRSPDKAICECCHPTALFDPEGNLAVMWRNSIEGMRDMWFAERAKGAAQFSAARKLGEGSWTLNGCPMDGGRLVAFGQGRFGAVWQRAGEVFFSSPSAAEENLGKGKQPVALVGGERPLVVWQQGADLVVRRAVAAAPEKRVSDARFPVMVALPGGRGALLAYERGSPKTGVSVVVEGL
jgi:hypothetical protein